ncbi:MAG: DUF2339 domain-containing protein, partial [Hyphomicrobiaceae bacterium]
MQIIGILVVPLLLALLAGAALSFFQIVQISSLREDVRRLNRELAKLKDSAVAVEPARPAGQTSAAHFAIVDTPDAADETTPESAQPDAEALAARAASPDPAAPPPVPPAGDTGDERPMGFEDRLGSQWMVWIGGIALALGGIFLVKYSIDQGWLGPAMRIFLGAVLAGVLGWLGEYTRRTDVVDQIRARRPEQFAGLSNAYVPGVLTAAGLMTAFATAYAAYALYGFIGGLGAFLVLAILSVAGLAVSVWHGPGLAALGLVGGYVTPALISSNAPSAWALFTYLLFITGAVYLTAWFRGWLSLARLACAGSILWAVLWFLTTYKSGDALPLAIYVIGLAVLGLVFLRNESDDAVFNENAFDWPVLQILAVNAALAAVYVMMEGHGQLSTSVTAALMALFLSAAMRWRQLLPLGGLAALLFGAHLATWPEFRFWSLVSLSPYGAVGAGGSGRLLSVSIAGVAALAGVGLWHTFKRAPHFIWGGIATAVPVLAFTYVYLRATHFEASLPYAIAGFGLAMAYGLLAERLDRVEEYADVAVPDRAWTVGALAAAASAFVALALTIYLEKGWLTIGLAAMAPALAWISTQRPISILRWITAIIAAIVVARLLWDPRIVGDALGTTPIFNWILYGYGVPTLAFGVAAWLLLRDGDDLPAQIVRGAAMAFGATLVGMEIRHLMNGGNVFASRFGLAELATHTVSWLGFSLGLRW